MEKRVTVGNMLVLLDEVGRDAGNEIERAVQVLKDYLQDERVWDYHDVIVSFT